MNDDRKYHKVMVELVLSVFSEDILILAMSSPNIGHTVSGLNSIRRVKIKSNILKQFSLSDF